MTFDEWMLTPDEDAAPATQPAQRRGMTFREWMLTPDPPELRTAPPATGDITEPSLMERFAPTAARMAGPVGGALIGGAIAGPPGAIIGGALGGGGGEVAATAMEGREQSIPRVAVGAVGGALMPGPGGALRNMIGREALANVGLNVAQNVVEGRPAISPELPIAALLGGAGGAAQFKLQPRAPTATGPVLPAVQPELPPTVPGPPAPNAGPFARFDEAPVLPQSPMSELPVTGERLPPEVGPPAPFTRTQGEPEFTPILEGPGGAPAPPRLVSPSGDLIAPPSMMPEAPRPTDIVQPGAMPARGASEDVLRQTLGRRGLPPEEIERIVRETTPAPEPAPRVPLEPAPPYVGSGGQRIAGEEIRVQEPAENVARALQGEEPPGPDFEVLPYNERQTAAMQKLERPPSPLADRLEQEPLLAREYRYKPGMEAKYKQNAIQEELQDKATALNLRREFPTLEGATEHAYSLMETQPLRAQKMLEDIDMIGADRRYRAIFNDQRTLSEIFAAQASEGARPLADMLASQSGMGGQALIGGITKGGAGALIGGLAPADTTEERLRNAAIGAGVGVGGPALLSRLMRGGKPPTASPVENIAQVLGQEARRVEAAAMTNDFRLAHGVADEAMKHIDDILARSGEVTKDNRLYKLVHDVLLEPGAERTARESTVSNAGRLLQRYSALAQELQRRAASGDKEAEALLGSLFGGGKGVVGNIAQFFRGSLVGRVATGIRNARDQGSIIGTSMLDKLYAGTIEGIATGKPLQGVNDAYNLGAAATSRAWKGFSELAHIAQKEPDKLQKVFDTYPEQAQRALAKPEGFEGVTKTGKTLAKGANVYLEAVNKVNSVQEQYFRKLWMEADMKSQLQKAGIDPEEAFANPQLIPDEMVEHAVDAALTGTFQNVPKNALAKEVVGVFARHPYLYAVAPFPRYIANRMQYIVEHNPLALTRLMTQGTKRRGLQGVIAEQEDTLARMKAAGNETEANKAAFNIKRATEQMGQLDSNSQIVGKWLSGLTMVSAGAALRDSSIAGEHWWEVKPEPGSNERIDLRADSTLAGYMFVAELAKQIKETGGIAMSGDDMKQGIQLLGLRSGVGLPLLDMFSGRTQPNAENIQEFAADLAGSLASGFFNPISQTKDVAAMFDPEQSKFRDTRDTAATRLYGPALNQLPYARDVLPSSGSATRAQGKEVEFPGSHLLGVTKKTVTPIEKELAKLGIENASLYPREGKPADTRAVLKGQGRFVEEKAPGVIGRPEYQALPRPAKRLVLKDLLQGGRQAGLAALTPERVRDILLRRQPKEVQELRRMYGR